MMESVAEYLFNYLGDVLFTPARAVLDVKKLPDDFQDLGEGLLHFVQCVQETRTLAKELSEGNLHGKLPSSGNEIAAPLKSLHASLRHLSWQSQQVAQGDYKQRIGFMGDFATAFNTMIEQLDQRRTALLQEIEDGRQKTQALADSNDMFEALTAQISQWIVVINREDGEFLFANRPMASIVPEDQLWQQLREWLAEQSRVTGKNSGAHCMEVELRHGGVIRYFSATIHPMYWRGHNATAFVLTDISAAKEQIRELENVAYLDTVTKVYNRHYGMKALNEWLAEGRTFIICFVDMDNLKFVNDKYGHAEGDTYIMCVVSILRDFSPEAIVCRLGGDEFMLLAQGWGLHSAEKRLEMLRSRLIQYNKEPGAFYNHSMSYGVIDVMPEETREAGDLLSIADEKMYAYKRAHKAQRQDSAVSAPEAVPAS